MIRVFISFVFLKIKLCFNNSSVLPSNWIKYRHFYIEQSEGQPQNGYKKKRPHLLEIISKE